MSAVEDHLRSSGQPSRLLREHPAAARARGVPFADAWPAARAAHANQPRAARLARGVAATEPTWRAAYQGAAAPRP